MFIFEYFKGILNYLGLAKKNAKILFLGLDNAGKTTLMRRLKDDKMVQHNPTQYAHSEELTLGNVTFQAHDLGGHMAMRKIWKTYFPGVNGIIYLVDASAPERIEESKIELDGILEYVELKKVPIVILGNKIDKKGALQEEELREQLGLLKKTPYGTEKIQEIDGRPIDVYMCSVAKKTGYAEGFQWLSKFLN